MLEVCRYAKNEDVINMSELTKYIMRFKNKCNKKWSQIYHTDEGFITIASQESIFVRSRCPAMWDNRSLTFFTKGAC